MGPWDRIKNNKIVLGFVIFDILAIITLIVINVVSSFRTAKVDISVVPTSAKVTLNGKSYDNNSVYNMFPKDNVKVEISHPDLETKTFEIDLERNNTTIIRNYLSGKNDDFSWYARNGHMAELDGLKVIANSQREDPKLKAFVKSANILDELPFSFDKYNDDLTAYTNFSIELLSDDSSCDKGFCLSIIDRSTGPSKEEVEAEVKRLIEDKGYKAEDYNFIYSHEASSVRAGDN